MFANTKRIVGELFSLRSEIMERRFVITIDFATTDPDYTDTWRIQNITHDIAERIGCEESDIEIEEVEE